MVVALLVTLGIFTLVALLITLILLYNISQNRVE
jgi:hypothetical protein